MVRHGETRIDAPPGRVAIGSSNPIESGAKRDDGNCHRSRRPDRERGLYENSRPGSGQRRTRPNTGSDDCSRLTRSDSEPTSHEDRGCYPKRRIARLARPFKAGFPAHKETRHELPTIRLFVVESLPRPLHGGGRAFDAHTRRHRARTERRNGVPHRSPPPLPRRLSNLAGVTADTPGSSGLRRVVAIRSPSSQPISEQQRDGTRCPLLKLRCSRGIDDGMKRDAHHSRCQDHPHKHVWIGHWAHHWTKNQTEHLRADFRAHCPETI